MACRAPAGAKRACDACHRRKVRCNGSNPCQNCAQSSLACTFDKPPQKKGPKGSRAKVISELRKSQELSGAAPILQNGFPFESPRVSPVSARGLENLDPEVVEICISSFFDKMYPTIPIVPRVRMQQAALSMGASGIDYCLVGSMCAFTLIQPGIPHQIQMEGAENLPLKQDPAKGARILEDIIPIHKNSDYVDNPTTEAVIVSFFLSASFFGLEKHNAAWYYLKEAITLAQLIHADEELTYRPGDMESMMRRRLFWVLFLSERAHALHKHRPLTLRPSIHYPLPDGNTDEAIAITGFTCLIKLFEIIDDTVCTKWYSGRSECSPAWLAQLQRHITMTIPEDLKCTDIQEADLRITQQWLHAIVWQLSTASGCLSSTSPDIFMRITYPMEIAKEVSSLLSRTPHSAMEIHGIGFVEKLFDIACILTDVMLCLSDQPSTFEFGPRDYLYQFLFLISTLRGGSSRYVGLLQAKIRETIPSMASFFTLPMPSHISHTQSVERLAQKMDDSSTTSSSPSHYGSPVAFASTTNGGRYSAHESNPTSPSFTSAPSSLGLPDLEPVMTGGPMYQIPYSDGFHVRMA